LPEYHLTNWKPNDPEFLSVVEKCDGYLRRYQDLAKECGICESVYFWCLFLVFEEDGGGCRDSHRLMVEMYGIRDSKKGVKDSGIIGGSGYYNADADAWIGIVPGTIVESHKENEKEEDRLLNVCYFIDHNGTITGKYIKKNLWFVNTHPYHHITTSNTTDSPT
jgi:predicted amidohydrolase